MHIAIAVDLSMESRAAVAWGLALRDRLRDQGRASPVSAVCVISQAAPFHHHSLPGYDSELSDRGARHRLAHRLRNFIKATGHAIDDVRIVLRDGDPTEELAAFCRDQYADMLVCGASSVQGLSRLIMGSTAHQLLDAIACPLVVAHPHHTKLPAHPQWVVGIDFHPGCVQALWEAARLADLSAARLHLVHALEDGARGSTTPITSPQGAMASSTSPSSSPGLAARTADSRRSLQSMMAEVTTRFPALEYATFAQPAQPAALINDYIQKRDAHAAFLGTRPQGRLERWLYPSVARAMLKRLPTTMIFVPSPDP